jgi:hypothetical protein
MEESNGTNMKPILPIIFFNKRMKIGDVLVLRRYSWRERLRGTITPSGVKVLISLLLHLSSFNYYLPSHSHFIFLAPVTYCILSYAALLMPCHLLSQNNNSSGHCSLLSPSCSWTCISSVHIILLLK